MSETFFKVFYSDGPEVKIVKHTQLHEISNTSPNYQNVSSALKHGTKTTVM